MLLHGEVCIPVSACQQLHPSNVILNSAHELSYLNWRALLSRQNVNISYNHSFNTYHICFRNVTESFLFLEYCDVHRVQPCESGSTFCCNSWVEFVSRTCVNVIGGGGKSYLFIYCINSLVQLYILHAP